MARKKKNECTTHIIALCPENKCLVKKKQADIEKVHESNITQAINQIIEEWGTTKKP